MPQGPIPVSVGRTFQRLLSFLQLDPQASAWVSDRHAKYYASTYGTPAIVSPATAAVAGGVFRGANQTAASLSAALATTYTGLCLSNPAGSGVNLAIKKITGIITAAPSGMLGLGLIAGWAAAGITVHTTALDANIFNSYVGAAASGTPPIAGPAPKAHLDAACTLVGTPTWIEWPACNPASTQNPQFYADEDDSLILPPGAYLAIGGTSANGGFFGSFHWEELPP